MSEPIIKSKQFVTHNVPGFEDGHPLKLRPAFSLSGFDRDGKIELIAERETENKVQMIALIPATPEAWDAHVRVKLSLPPKDTRVF